MEKINFNFDIKENLNEIKRELLNNDIAKSLIEELKITDEELNNHYELLFQYIKTNKDCLNCHDIKKCQHSTRGYQYTIKRDMQGFLTDSLSVCSFYKKYYQKKNNIVYSTFKEEHLLDHSNLNFLKDNAHLFGNENLMKLLKIMKREFINGIYFHLNDAKIRKKLLLSLSDTLLEKNLCSIIKFSTFLSNLKEQFGIPQASKNLFDKVMTSPILIIDDLGGEAVSAWSRDEILLPLLDYRIQNDLTTIICSDYDLNHLKNIYQKSKNDEVKAIKVVDKIKELIN